MDTRIEKAKKTFAEASMKTITPKESENNSLDITSPQSPQSPHLNLKQANNSVLQETEQTESFKKYSSYSFAEFCKEPAPIKYYIKGYVQEKALEMIFGKPGSAKSFVALDMAASIACPEINTWHGKSINHAPVIYFAGEGVAGLRKRCAGWAVKRGINPENVQIAFIDETFHIDDNSDIQHDISSTIENIKALYPNPALVIIDTLNTYMSGDENKATDVGRILSDCKKIMKELNCTVLIVHHTGVSSEAQDRARGSSALRGAMDIELSIEKTESLVTLKQTKNKESEEEKPLFFNLEKMQIPDWFDEEGEAVSTCTIELNNTELAKRLAEQNKQAPKISKNEETAITTFKEAITRNGIRIHDEKTGHDLAAIFMEDWRPISYELSGKATTKAKQQEFDRGREGLYKKEILLKRIRENREYYCLDISDEGKGDSVFKICVSRVLKEREDLEQPKKQEENKNIVHENDITMKLF